MITITIGYRILWVNYIPVYIEKCKNCLINFFPPRLRPSYNHSIRLKRKIILKSIPQMGFLKIAETEELNSLNYIRKFSRKNTNLPILLVRFKKIRLTQNESSISEIKQIALGLSHFDSLGLSFKQYRLIQLRNFIFKTSSGLLLLLITTFMISLTSIWQYSVTSSKSYLNDTL